MSLFAIERNQGTAVYAQIARILETEFIKNGMPGDRLPSESSLAEQFGVNRHTLRRAVDELISAGMVERFHGIGIFVSKNKLITNYSPKPALPKPFMTWGCPPTVMLSRALSLKPPKALRTL